MAGPLGETVSGKLLGALLGIVLTFAGWTAARLTSHEGRLSAAEAREQYRHEQLDRIEREQRAIRHDVSRLLDHFNPKGADR